MDSTKDYYSVLGVLPDAEDIVIRAAYKALAQRYHPDRSSGSKDEANRIMASINEAYSVLSDPFRRREYDQAHRADTNAREFHSKDGSNDVSSRYDPPRKPESDSTESQRPDPATTSSAKSKFDFLSVESALIFVIAIPLVFSGLWLALSGEREVVAKVAQHEAKDNTVRIESGRVFKDCVDCPEMVEIPAGSFEMGSGHLSKLYPGHTVRFAKKYSIAKTEVTQEQWQAVMGANPSFFLSCGDRCPVENLTKDDIHEFLSKLSQKTGQTYRLPSEAEWEHACRGGGDYTYCGSENFNDVSWNASNSDKNTHPVARKQPNAFGIFDMSGNVWEWTEDCWGSEHTDAPDDGSARSTGDCTQRVLRGGSFANDKSNLTSTVRHHFAVVPSNGVGFRPVRVFQ